MAKLKDCAVKVKTNAYKKPLSFCWNNRWFPVEAILDCWKDTGSWWKGETEKTFFRIASGKEIFELYFELYNDKSSGHWHLYSIYD